MRRLVVILVVIGVAVACQQGANIQSSADADYDRGKLAGWNQALEAVRNCAVDGEPGTFPDCLASQAGLYVNSEQRMISETYDDFIERGKQIELAFFVYDQG
ncbi:MAG: hypothetical protein WD895_03315 [Acidimicrobiia bacterium]